MENIKPWVDPSKLGPEPIRVELTIGRRVKIVGHEIEVVRIEGRGLFTLWDTDRSNIVLNIDGKGKTIRNLGKIVIDGITFSVEAKRSEDGEIVLLSECDAWVAKTREFIYRLLKKVFPS